VSGALTLCRSCGLEYDLAAEVTCPGCTSGHVVPRLPVGVPKLDPRQAARARMAVEHAQKELMMERQNQSVASARRRSDRRIGKMQMAFGIALALAGAYFFTRLSEVPLYGPIIRWVPVLIGGGYVLMGAVRMIRTPE
jgi:hypothetical protein